MELAEALRRRRMCRDFRPDPLSPTTVQDLVGAATAAPSAGNSAALDVVVLSTPAAVARYWDVTLPAGPRRRGFGWPGLLRAPVLVLAYVDPARYLTRYGEPDKARTGLGAGEDRWPVPYWWVDGGACVMAMLLRATDLGLGALFFGQFAHEAGVAAAFGVPDGRRALGTVAFGLPAASDAAGRSAARGRRRVEEIVHFDRW